MTDPQALEQLAERAGISVHWSDAHGLPHTVGQATLEKVLAALGLPADSHEAIAASQKLIDTEDAARGLAPMITAEASQPIRISGVDANATIPYRFEFEFGQVTDGIATSNEAGEVVLPGIRPTGYHRLTLGAMHTTLAVAPPRCYGVADALTGAANRSGSPGRAAPFGVNLQVYALRRDDASGIGDFSALDQFCIALASLGVDAVGINPVHAGFNADPSRFSPYAPSSRLFLNPLYIDPSATLGKPAMLRVMASLGLDAALVAVDALSLIDWPATAAVRMATLRGLYDERDTLLNSQLRAELEHFVADGGDALRDHARYEALHALRHPGTAGWREWPEEEQNPTSHEVERFALEEHEEVGFHCFLQWLARRDMDLVQRHARAAGMSIGLVADLAVGTDPGGSQAWSRQGEIIRGVVCGAPPDLYTPLGQSWGLSAFSPRGLKQSGFRAFIEMLRSTLATSGALRIDHVLGLARLWLVPEGEAPTEGAYVTYPLTDMLRLVALESWRHHAIIVGENLGTVPPGFNQTLDHFGVLGTTVLWFERSYQRIDVEGADGMRHQIEGFRSPASWTPADLAVSTTHDLPTTVGWWEGHDVEWRAALSLLAPTSSLAIELAQRSLDRRALWRALEEAQLVAGPVPDADAAPLDAILKLVASAPSALVMFPVEDLLGLAEQPNLPGTFDQHPNWRRRLALTVAQIVATPGVKERLAEVQSRRRGDS